jgi:NAD(P)-dependent dehydrogenase (short-subunit alcohol dehydrogenase family)
MTQSKQSNAPVVLITGAGRGLGRSMALHLADRGTDVIITYRSGAKEAEDVVASIQQKGRKAVALPLDVRDTKSFGAFAEAVQNQLRGTFGRERLYALVNNAGTGGHAAFAETTEAQFDDLVAVHLKATFFLSQKLLSMLEDGGRILNVSSGLTRMTFPGYGAYASVKSAIEALTRYMAKELGPRKITVNVLAPGAVETDFGGGRVRDNRELNQQIAAITALGRVGLPDDIGAVASLLLAPESGWITGQRIEASGGQGL